MKCSGKKLHGASSMPKFPTNVLTHSRITSIRSMPKCSTTLARKPMRSLQRGVKGELGIRLLMQACGNCEPKVGCITECEWLWHRSCSRTFTSNGNVARTISLTGYSMAILLAIVMVGNGRPVVALMLRRITASLIQSDKASSLIQMANTFVNTFQSFRTSQVAQFMNRGMFQAHLIMVTQNQSLITQLNV